MQHKRRAPGRAAAASLLSMTVMMMAALAASCSAGGGKAPDGSIDVVRFDVTLADFPEGCPESVVPNNKGVGSACTKGGGQCDGSRGLFCACDGFPGVEAPAGTPCLCTLPIVGMPCEDPRVAPDYCGESATCCGYPGLGALCVPNLCLGNSSMCPTFTI